MTPSKLEEAYARCQSEAMAAFGNGDVYVERLIRKARHIEVQIIGDRHGAISHLWERECTIQRRNQKLIEVAPSPSLSEALRARIIDAAKQLAAAAQYDNLGTFEFLVDDDARATTRPFAFIEANPRLQVEHTVTEEVLGVDLVQSQLAVAGRRHARLARAGAGLCAEAARLRHAASRQHGDDGRNRRDPADRRDADDVRPAVRPRRARRYLWLFRLPDQRRVRLAARQGDRAFAGRQWTDVVQKAIRALREFRIGGVATNIPFLAAILAHPDFAANRISTGFIDTAYRRSGRRGRERRRRLLVESGAPPMTRRSRSQAAPSAAGPAGSVPVPAPLQGTIVAIDVTEGDLVRPGQQIAVLESMKMEHLVNAPHGGKVTRIASDAGTTLMQGEAILFLEPVELDDHDVTEEAEVDLDHIRPDLAELIARHAITRDENRPARSSGGARPTSARRARTSPQLVDPGSFVEYGSLAIAAQRRRRKVEDLIHNTPADGLISGVATVNADKFGAEAAAAW